MVPTPLRPEASGQDLPNKVKFIGGIKSSTVLVAENAPKSTSKSRIPLRSQGAKVKPTISPLKPKRPKTVVGHEKTEEVQSQRYKSPSPTFEDDFDEQYDDEEEETDDENGAFMGSAPRINRADIDVKNGLPENEEEELELVFIEALNCYYCPNNQQYYQIDD
ncbi:hypothetical protein TRFO_08413 [Tritrichomonas foetus]|uniref:Uncharacterized protein n=1 Tax=Tritrichomonas foetus TaxID=1144522 RepID=A0A1J4JPM9_9EUKA|nr:hypothetical protein TRFO_08413 [Tritrichomonas foetus]|eukprot:OHS99467.1 hypothetical protein TRFO_08413 [Tritrichomonas foetus]